MSVFTHPFLSLERSKGKNSLEIKTWENTYSIDTIKFNHAKIPFRNILWILDQMKTITDTHFDLKLLYFMKEKPRTFRPVSIRHNTVALGSKWTVFAVF